MSTKRPPWHEILDFDLALVGVPRGPHDAAIRQRFGITPATYSLYLNEAIDLPEALRRYPAHVARLRRIRDKRRANCFPKPLQANPVTATAPRIQGVFS